MKYLFTARYSEPAGMSGLAADGGSARVAAIKQLAESLGGKVESHYFAFGEVDAYTIIELPDNVAATALSLAVGATGMAVLHTIPLITPEEVDQAAKMTPVYDPPGPEGPSSR